MAAGDRRATSIGVRRGAHRRQGSASGSNAGASSRPPRSRLRFLRLGRRALSLGPASLGRSSKGAGSAPTSSSRRRRSGELLAAYLGVVLQAFQEVEDALVAFSHEQAARGAARGCRACERARRRPRTATV